MFYPSKKIKSSQREIHENLYEILEKHRKEPFRKPIARHTLEAFRKAENIISAINCPLILDSGCGVGESTIRLAQYHSDAFVLGIDKSYARLQKHRSQDTNAAGNYFFLRCDLIDFWRLAVQAGWEIEKHYILYPNPWPKKKDIRKRFHGHPVFWDLIRLGRIIELRSNWEIYLREFAAAYAYATGKEFRVNQFHPSMPMTPFERKYLKSGHRLFRLVIENS